jgi:hypothetical protein
MRRRASLMRPEQMENSLLQIIHKQELVDGGSGTVAIIPEETETDFDTASVRTEKRSNTSIRDDIRASLRKSLRLAKPLSPMKLKRTKSDVDEVEHCLVRSRQNFQVDLVRDFHRDESGNLRERKFKDSADEQGESKQDDHHQPTIGTSGSGNRQNRHKSTFIGAISPPMKLTKQTMVNLGKVHYQLAVSDLLDHLFG